MAKQQKKSPAGRRPNWQGIPDHLHRSFLTRPNLESLHPNADTVLAAVCGSPTSRAIICAYAFKFPVTLAEVINDDL